MYRQRTNGWNKHLDFIILDLVVLQFSFIVAYCLRHGWVSPYTQEEYRAVSLFLIIADIVGIFLFEPFEDILKRGYWKEMKSCLQNAVFITLASTFYLFAVQAGQEYSRITCFLTGAIYLVLAYSLRLGWKAFLKKNSNTRARDSMLVATEAAAVPRVLAHIHGSNAGLPSIQGIIVLDTQQADSYQGIPVVATADTMENYVCRHWVDELLVVHTKTLGPQEEQFLQEKLQHIAISGVAVHNAICIPVACSETQQIVEKVAGYTVLTNVVKSVTSRQAFLKRALDIVGGLVGCVLAGVALLIVGPIIYIQSPGPIVFRQKRVGRNGKIFTMYKIRSMVMDADAKKAELMKENRVSGGMMFKLDFDPRIIGARKLPNGTVKKGIGNYIRDWSIDELPQFWNVVKGDMSLVGTRPPTLDEWQKYELYHRARMAFRPGITGMWQVSGRSEITDFDEVVKLDMKYINEWSLGLDFRILLQTVLAVVKKEGAM